MLRSAARKRRGALLIRDLYRRYTAVGPGSAERRESAAPPPGHDEMFSLTGQP